MKRTFPGPLFRVLFRGFAKLDQQIEKITAAARQRRPIISHHGGYQTGAHASTPFGFLDPILIAVCRPVANTL